MPSSARKKKISESTGLHVRQHGQHRIPQCLSGTCTAAPSEPANPVAIQPHNRHISLPAALATRVAEYHLRRSKTYTFHCQLRNFRHCDVIAGRDIVSRKAV